MLKLTTLLTSLVLLSGAALAQEAPPTPTVPADATCDNLKDVPNAGGLMLLPLRDTSGIRTIDVKFSSALTCETERCRLRRVGVFAQCVRVK